MKVYNNFPLSKILYYKIGGIAQYVLKIENKEDLLEALDFVKKNKIKKSEGKVGPNKNRK